MSEHNAENGARLYATAEEARRAVDDAAYADGGQPDPHTYLGGISDEAECYCGIQMPLNEDGSPRLTFEEWIEYHDEVQMRTLETDATLYAESDEHPDNQPLRTRDFPPGKEQE